MAKKSSTKIKQMTPEKVAARKGDALRKAVNDVGAKIGLPECQRDPGLVRVVDTPALVKAGARADKTIRKLTRAEMLHRSGAIGKHHLEAITRYSDSAELAYGATVRATQYGEGGGSSPTGSASAAHSRQLNRAYDADRYQAARRMLPVHFADAFDAVVIENQQIGTVGEQLYPALKASAISSRMRDMVQACASALCVFYGIEADDQKVRLAATMVRMDTAVRAQPRVADALDELALRAVVEGGTGIIVSRSVLADLVREHALDAEPVTWGGLPLLVNEGWQFGWMMQRAA